MSSLSGQIGVAISTTGDDHRLPFLETSVQHWQAVLPEDAPMFVTVDGSAETADRVACLLSRSRATVLRVGQPLPGVPMVSPFGVRDGRLGVAANKNTGLEALMDSCSGRDFPSVEHLFLCDDDTWPLHLDALTLHTSLSPVLPHSMVCWGRNRLDLVAQRRMPTGLRGKAPEEAHACWNWPRGVLLYTHRSVISQVGGMDERFGPGGHEHVEWSRRIHQAGLTPAPFVSPARYAHMGIGARGLWHCEDMPQPGEPLGNLRLRRRRLTSVRREDGDWTIIEKIMAERDGDTRFVSFRATPNGRATATVGGNLTGQGAASE